MKLSQYEMVVKSVCNDQRRVNYSIRSTKNMQWIKYQSYKMAVEKYSFLLNLFIYLFQFV